MSEMRVGSNSHSTFSLLDRMVSRASMTLSSPLFSYEAIRESESSVSSSEAINLCLFKTVCSKVCSYYTCSYPALGGLPNMSASSPLSLLSKKSIYCYIFLRFPCPPWILSVCLCLSILCCSPIILASANRFGGSDAIVASSRPAKISALNLGSVTVAMKLATSICSAYRYGWAPPLFLSSFSIMSLLYSSGMFSKKVGSSPSSKANAIYSG